MPCSCGASSCPECMGGYRPSEEPYEAAYRSALQRIEHLTTEIAALRAVSRDQGWPLVIAGYSRDEMHTAILTGDTKMAFSVLEEVSQYHAEGARSTP